MKDIGLVGATFSGKSTLFTALTHAGSHGGQANVAVVPVPDPRLQVLTDLEHSKKTVAAQVRFVDVPGGLSSAQSVAKLREVDALAVVVRCFGTDAAPASEVADVRADLLLADLSVIESALTKAVKKARGKPGIEVEALEAARTALDAETALRDARLAPEHVAELKGIAPLTLKPEIVIANLEEGTTVPADLGRCGRRLCRDRGGGRRDGPRGGARAARGVRRDRAWARDRDRGLLPGARPDHVPDHRRGRDARLGGAPRRERSRGGRARSTPTCNAASSAPT